MGCKKSQSSARERSASVGHGGWGVPFRPLTEHEVWIGDIVFLTPEKAAASRTKWLLGAPDLVIEVLSPSNTAEEMIDREDLCLRSGARQFWTVSAERQSVKVTSADGRTATYRPSDEINLAVFGGGRLAVSEIFPKWRR